MTSTLGLWSFFFSFTGEIAFCTLHVPDPAPQPVSQVPYLGLKKQIFLISNSFLLPDTVCSSLERRPRVLDI